MTSRYERGDESPGTKQAENFLTRRGSVRFSRQTLLCGVSLGVN
jgi:hypothetical protein